MIKIKKDVTRINNNKINDEIPFIDAENESQLTQENFYPGFTEFEIDEDKMKIDFPILSYSEKNKFKIFCPKKKKKTGKFL